MPLDFPKPTTTNDGRRLSMPLVGVRQMVDRNVLAGNSDVASRLGGLVAAYGRVLESHERFMRDATITANARLVRSARNARATLEPAVAALRQARDTAAGVRANCERQVEKLFDLSSSFAECMLAGEVRRHFAALSGIAPDTSTPSPRLAALNEAIAAKDIATLKAIAAGPCYLSGLDGGRHAMAKNTLIALDPAAAAARDAATALAEQEKVVAQVEATVLESTANLIDFASAQGFERVASEAVAAA